MAERLTTMTSKRTGDENDKTAIINAARHDPKMFGEVYKMYVEQVYRYLFSRVGNQHEAEDLTAQTFLAAFETIKKLRQSERFTPWLFTIARNKTMDHFRYSQRSSEIGDADKIADENDSLSEIIQSEEIRALTNLVTSLPEDERELLRLRFLAEMSFREMANLLHRKEDAVKKSVYRLLARLHSRLEVTNE